MQEACTDEESSTNKQFWQRWCRLCAREANNHNVQVFCKNNDSFTDPALITAIGRYFWVNITPNDKLPNTLCLDCHELISALMAFSEHVNKVQSMYYALISAGQCDLLDAHKLREQHGVLEPQWPLIMRQRQDDEIKVLKWSEQEQEQQEEITTLELRLEMHNGDVETETEENVKEEHVEDSDDDELTETEANEFRESELSNIKIIGDVSSGQIELEDEAVYDSGEDSESVGSKENKLSEEQCKRTRRCKRTRFSQEEEHEKNDLEENICEKKQELDVEGNEVDLKSSSEYKYACNICGRKYKNPTSYRRHMLESHNRQPDIPDFKCEECGKILPTEKQLNMHARTHLPLELKMDVPCPYCDKKFTKLTVMRQHINGQHFNQKPFVCDECGKALKTLAALNEHKLVHTNECPFECTVCHKRFKNKARLKVSWWKKRYRNVIFSRCRSLFYYW